MTTSVVACRQANKLSFDITSHFDLWEKAFLQNAFSQASKGVPAAAPGVKNRCGIVHAAHTNEKEKGKSLDFCENKISP